MKANLITLLTEAQNTHWGFSYNINTGDVNPKRGFMASVKGYELKVPDESNLFEVGIEYVKNNAHKLMENGMYLGLWFDDGYAYFDVSRNFNTMTRAMKFARENEQLAIWDCKRNEGLSL
jgi:hypothetical protein